MAFTYKRFGNNQFNSKTTTSGYNIVRYTIVENNIETINLKKIK